MDKIDLNIFEEVAEIVVKINAEGSLRVQTLFNGDFRDHLRDNPNDRKSFTDDFLVALNRSIDEDGKQIYR